MVIQEITASEIEEKYHQIKAAKDGPRVRMGSYFMSIVEFLEKASTMFSGFLYDINQMIIEKDIFIYMFDIIEYYSNSDFIVQKAFKILINIFKAKNEDI